MSSNFKILLQILNKVKDTKGTFTVGELASDLEIDVRKAEKLLFLLIDGKLIKQAGSGFELNRPASEIMLDEVYHISPDDSSLISELNRQNDSEKQPFLKVINSHAAIERALKKDLKKISLEEYFKSVDPLSL